MYSSNPTYSKGNIVTDEDLEKLSEALYIKETNNANSYITVNLQKQTTSSSLMDQAPQPLLTISTEAFQIPTIQRVLSIFDNYQLDTLTNEYINPAQRQEESLLLDTFLSTNVMSTAMRFLADKGFVRRDYYEYKDILRRIWFNLFSRGQGKIGSTGFEHVFMAETKQVDSDVQILGLHNWIYFNAEEIKRRADYLGYIKKTDLGNKGSIIKMHVKFNNHDKPVTSMFVGISPELEMSLYTVCFYARPDGSCPVSLGGTKFNIITRKFRYRGKDLVGTAYPEI
ncbi:placental protein 11 [Lasius niger]|uniref:Placental protein 11 n=2 Tax=Lasius TaxID=488720 RepID=A0A0J7MSF7_LASNI|nr:placental protein 11 [Lasius niger]